MADEQNVSSLEASSESDVLAGLLSASSNLESFESLEAAFTTSVRRSSGSFRTKRHASESIDIELDVPEVTNMPTLESILNEKDDDGLALEDDPELASLLQEECFELSLEEQQKKNKQQSKHAFVLRHIVLKSVSAQMVSASARVDAGLPTAMSVSNVIAVGTSHGIVLIFDPQQTLKLVLGTTQAGAEYGAVTALGINMDCSRLLCGHSRGQITMWDLQSGKLIRSIFDAHPLGSAVLHIMFTDDPAVAVCSDSGGSVFVLSFKRVIGMRTYESTCLFSGSRGEVCTMAPLHMPERMKDHKLYDYSMLALATLTKVLVLSLKPSLEVLFTHTLKGSSDTLPLLSWQFAIIQVASSKVVDPVIAFARRSEVFYYQAHSKPEGKVQFMFLQRMETPYKLIALQWLNSHVIVTLDTMERLHAIDVRSCEELEVLDLSNVQLVYSSSFFKSLATGGNVSKALAAASEHSCYQTTAVFNGQMLLLGVKSIHVLTIRTWKDRISVLVRQNEFGKALQLALSFYDGSAKAVVGLFGDKESRKQEVAAEVEELLLAYVDICVFVNCPKTRVTEELASYFEEIVPTFIEYCLAINNMDVLFRDIYDKFCEEPSGKVTFLKSLEPYILADRLTSLSAIVMKDFIEHYQAQGKLKEVESCLVHLDVTNLDIDQMVKLCWAHELYDAIFYVYNRGMRDYISPLEELTGVLKTALKSNFSLTDQKQALGYKILVFISCSLAGRAYPVGEIPLDIVKVVKMEVFNFLTVPHSKNGEEKYPTVRVLLKFDTQEFLNVLSLAFEEKEFDEEFSGPNGETGRQFVVNLLLEVMVQNTGFSPSQVGYLFTFLARQMAKHENRIHVNKVLFEQVLEYLANPDDDSRHEERQQALLELLNAGGLKQFDDERILVLAENAKFYRVCELLYEKKRKFAKILSCYFRDPFRKEQVFRYIQNVMTDDAFTDLEREEVKETALDSLQTLVSISCRQTAHLVLSDLPDALTMIVNRLEGQVEIQYEFLKGVFDPRNAPTNRPELNPEAQVHERYIDLMCRYESDTVVYRYLRGNENYRLEETLAIVRQYNNTYSTSYLLEKAGDVEGAFKLLLEMLQAKVNLLCSAFGQYEDTASNETRKYKNEVEAVLLVVVQLCQRNSGRLDEADREALWFPLLETVMAPQRKCKSTNSNYFIIFKDLTRHVLNSMMGYISLPAILQKIVQDPHYSSGKFGEIKELIVGMLDTYTYEKTLLSTTNHLLAADLHNSLSHLKRVQSQGLTPKSSVCGVCEQANTDENVVGKADNIVVFRCGHIYHEECLQGTVASDDSFTCILCHKTGTTRLSSHRVGATPRATTAKGGTKAKIEKHQSLSPQQFEAVIRLRKQNKSPATLSLLTELARTGGDAISLSYGSRRGSHSKSRGLLQDEKFRLQLAAPIKRSTETSR